MTHLVIVAHEAVGTSMTGPSIRNFELAKTLAADFQVTLAVPRASDLCTPGFQTVTYSRDNPESLESLTNADALLVSGFLLHDFPQLGRSGCPLIVDLYDPFPIENLQLRGAWSRSEQVSASAADFATVNNLLRAGDFFICGSERQRAFWLGMLASCGRVNPRTHAADPTLRNLIEVVPMGISDTPPSAGVGFLKGRLPGLASDDFLVVWPGGVWDWLDPLTAVDAVARIVSEAPDVKLYFPGLSHPHPERIGAMATPARVLERSQELGLLGRNVFYAHWTPYAQRGQYLHDADLALSLHHDTLEAHLAIRARLLDCIWACTPVVSTKGDVVAEMMAERGLATLIEPNQPDALAAAILDWRTTRPSRACSSKEKFQDLADRFRWSHVCEPLRTYLRRPIRAADHGDTPPRDESDPTARTTSMATPAARWDSDDVLNLPFDQYQRHRQAAQIIEALRESPDHSFHVLDVGGGPSVTRLFLRPTDWIVSLDLRPQAGPLTVVGDATCLPFGDRTFDVVVTLDTLEHLPVTHRSRMIDEIVRVARRGTVLIAPTASPEADTAEHILFEFIRVVLNVEHEQLREHLDNGLPELGTLEAYLHEIGYPYLVRPSGYIHRWLAMMLVKHHLMSLPSSETVHRQLDNYYNRHYFTADQRAPSYRSLIFIAKEGGLGAVRHVGNTLSVPDVVPESDAAIARDLGQLGLMLQLLMIKAVGIDPPSPYSARTSDHLHWLQDKLVSTEQRLAEAERLAKAREGDQHLQQRVIQLQQALEARDHELAAARVLLERIARGKVMRLMNALHNITGR